MIRVTGVDGDGDAKSINLVINLDYVANFDANRDTILTNVAAGTPIVELVTGRRRVRTQGDVPESIYVRRPAETQAWLAEGRLKGREDIAEGFETFPDALLRLFRGDNTGKLLLKVG